MEVTDTMINDYYKEFFFKNIKAGIDEFLKSSGKYVKMVLKEYYEQGSHKWAEQMLLKIANDEIADKEPHVLDVETIIANIGILKLKKDAKYRAEKAIERNCESNTVFLKGDGRRIRELLEKLAPFD